MACYRRLLITAQVFESFDLDAELIKSAYWVTEVCFWSADDNQTDGDTASDRIIRTGRTADTPTGLSHRPHVIMNQAYLNRLMLDDMKKHGGRNIDYEFNVKSVKVDDGGLEDPVNLTAEHRGREIEYRAKIRPRL